MKYCLIVPPIAETHLTGFRIAAEKIIGKTHWRMEYWTTDEMPKLYRNGKPFSLYDQPTQARKFTLDFAKFYREYSGGISPTY